ncbi:hypothetical protein TrRE_jg1617, partial [Triparma retinervis]
SRRSRLKNQIQSPSIAHHFPIIKYYSLAEQLLTLFHDANEKANLDESYVYAKRYCHLVYNVIPEHGYYNSKTFREEKLLSNKSAREVMDELEKIVNVMDVEEMQRQAEFERRIAEQKKERARIESEMETKRAEQDLNLPPPPSHDFDATFPSPPASAPEIDGEEVEDEHPPPVFEPSPEPDEEEERRPSHSTYNAPKAPEVPFRTLSKVWRMAWSDALRSKRASVYPLSTWQGRITSPGRNSTNGCTVISPLVVTAHLRSLGGVSDDEVAAVIDERAGGYLEMIRGKLGLSENALIIPSDVHDHFVDEKVLNQEEFVGVVGGNVLDVDHIQEIVKLLMENGDKKAGGVLFYHAHVISIVKLKAGKEVWFDLIDSLPFQHENANERGGARIRCKDVETLINCILWYASS